MHTVSRLIETFIPNKYTLSLSLDDTAMTFQGTVTIEGSTPRQQVTISLHAKELTINTASVDGHTVSWNIQDDELHLSSEDSFSEGPHTLTIGFSGIITEQMHGLYPSVFTRDGQKETLFATQFESHHAREVFPCIDEPEAKAVFDVTITTRTGWTVLGNMPVASQRVENEKLVTHFQTTPRMSTYLLAFVCGSLHAVTGKTKEGTEVSVWSTPNHPKEALEFALTVAIRTTEFLNEYFGVAYPLPKQDHVALPDFSSGAMENWGLITYREIALLTNPKTTSIEQKQYAATVIAHELSHQWFGNLVTMRWWNDLWLNESFANMMEYVVIDALYPEWNVWLDHAGYEVVQALRRDAIDGVQAVRVDVNHPDEISTLFDPSIVYAKGGRLLRMLQFWLGDEEMQTGLRAYFSKFAYQNTTADDLWQCLEEASGQPVAEVMHSWIQQPGYPIVHARRVDPKTIELTQEQFFIGAHEPSDRLWNIPLALAGSDRRVLMTTKTMQIEHTDAPLLNAMSSSHYIVQYHDELETEVLQTVTSWDPIERLKLLHEYTLLAKAEVLPMSGLLPFLTYYADETSEPVWGMLSLAIQELRQFVDPDSPAEAALKARVLRLASPLFTKIGWEEQPNESAETTKLRSVLISLLLFAEEPAVVKEALKRYDATTIQELNPELRVQIMSTAIKNQHGSVFTNLLRAHAEATTSELRDDIAAAITSTRDQKQIEELLELLTDVETIRPQDTARWIVNLMRNRFARSATWEWLQTHWDWIVEKFSGDMSYDAYPRYAASILRTREELASYKAFFGPLKSVVALQRNIEIGTTELEHRVNLIESQQPLVERALTEQ